MLAIKYHPALSKTEDIFISGLADTLHINLDATPARILREIECWFRWIDQRPADAFKAIFKRKKNPNLIEICYPEKANREQELNTRDTDNIMSYWNALANMAKIFERLGGVKAPWREKEDLAFMKSPINRELAVGKRRLIEKVQEQLEAVATPTPAAA